MTERKAHAGTLESNDIYISIETKPENFGIQINLQSVVMAQFGESIRSTLLATVEKTGFSGGLEVIANDKGALTCTIEARMNTALSRAGLLGETR